MKRLVLENKYKIAVLLFAAPNKGTILYWLRTPSTVLNPSENRKIQGLFKAFEWFSCTFQGRFDFQGFFKKALYIFKHLQTLLLHLCL